MIPINEFKPISRLQVEEHMLTRSKFPVIDAHNHLSRTKDVEGVLRSMDEYNVRMIVDLDGYPGDAGKYQLEHYVAPHPDRFTIFTQIDASRVDEPGFAREVENRISDCVSKGSSGIKFLKWLGLRTCDSSGRMLKPDDKRLKPIWEAAARWNIPVTIHIGDPIAFFDPISSVNERYEELIEHPDWSFADPKFYRFEELLEAQHNLLRDNPETRFIVAHVGSIAENLKRVGQMLDLYPNMYVDTAERIAELGRQPYSSREFILKYQDRVLYGTDLIPNHDNIVGNYRFFETSDEYFQYNSWYEHNQGRWNIYGINLPNDVLKKVYFANALKVIPKLKEFY